MKREGDGMPWTAPRKCKRSRLCVSTAGSPDGHLHLVLHFKRRSSFLSLTPSNHVETAQEHRRKPCVDRRVNGKIVKPQRVGSKSRPVGDTKRPTQLKSVHELEMKSTKSCESHGLESGNKSYVNKVADQKLPEPSTLMRKEERTSHTKEKPMWSKSGKEHRNSTNHTGRYKQYKVKYNGHPSHKRFTPLLNLRTGTTTKTNVKRTLKPNSCQKVMHDNSGHCNEPSENGVCKVKSQQKPSLKKKSELACIGTTVEDSRQSKWYVSPITHTRHEEKQFRQHEEKRCNQGEEKLAKTKTMSETGAQKLSSDPDRKESKVTKVEYKKKQAVSDNQKLSKLNKPEKKPAVLKAESRTASSIGLFQTCPWELESDGSSDDSDGEETKEELTELGNKQQTVPDKQQLSKVHKPAWKLQGATFDTERAIKSGVQRRNTSCTKVESTWSPTGTSGAMRQKSTAETGRSEKENFLKVQSRYAGKSELTTMNSASVHGQQRPLKNMCKEENIVEILQDKLVIAKFCDNIKESNGPITSADTSDVIDDVMKHRQPIRKGLASRSGGSVQNGPITVRNGSSEDDSSSVTVGMKQAAGSVSSPKKLEEVTDLMTLAPHEWLNDNVLNGYFDLLTEARPDDVYCFNTFFYTQLCRKGYQGVRRWTRKVQIFQKCLLLVPLHLGNHWCLAEVAVQDRLLYLYDSRGGANLTCLQRLVSYLCCEAEERGEANFTSGWDGTCREDIPVQETSGDCGVFVCQYARCIVEGRPMAPCKIPRFRVRNCRTLSRIF